ncbi:uncharacterized protein LOC112094363 [Morus notabilis]|uniref:uncharacterized protein LOC112094363 n=1 Tax=Morus notabilis TaxID=981085 RepID=UPI000CECECF2|nr:uncharacterized protein LOC112094363 [Morus notabilis]
MYTSHDHPFTENIIRVPLPDRYKPPPIPLYDGRSDPDDHLEVYTGHMVLHGYPEEGPNESLKDWIARFGEQVTATEGISDEVALMGALLSMKKDIPYSTDLDRRPPHTYQEFLTRAQGFINTEEAKKALKSKAAAPVKEEVGQASNQNNAECYDLRDGVERLIREGRLSEYQADRQNNNTRRNNNRREEQRHDNPPEPVSVIRTIFGGPYLGGTSHRAQKDYVREAKEKFSRRVMNVSGCEAKTTRYEEAEITFSEANANGVHFSQSDALVVEAMIGNHTVCRILVDNGSLVDILYSDCLDKTGIPRARLQNSAQPLYGFTGDSVIPKGVIELPMTIGDQPHTSTVMSKFLVVKGGDQYNAVIGRPTMRALKAAISIYH